MLYQNEFNKLKQIYSSLPDASRETAKIISFLPVASMALFGLVLVPLGIIGLGSVLVIGVMGTLASMLMMAVCIPCGDETGMAGVQAWAEVLLSLRTSLETASSDDSAPVLRMAANDAQAAEQPVRLAKRA